MTEPLITDLLYLIYEPDEAREWLSSPQALLGGETPQELIQRGESARVMNVVNRMIDCVYL